MQILQPPELEINKILYKNRPMPNHIRLEQRIIWNLLDHLQKAGFHPVAVVSDDVVKTPTAKAAMEEIFNLDDCHLHVAKPKGPKHWIFLVGGNETEIISDWGIPNIPDGFDEAMKAFNPDLYA